MQSGSTGDQPFRRALPSLVGAPTSGQLGNGTTQPGNVPAVVPTGTIGMSRAISIAAGEAHTCAILANGSLTCWGSNASRQLATAGADQPDPVLVAGVANVVAVATGDAHTCALIADGTVRCWGRGVEGQLGIGSNIGDSVAPVVVPGLPNVVSIAAGANHTCALIVDGTARCWGSNVEGQIGDGTRGANNNRNVPTAVNGLTGAVGISAGANHTCAMTPGVVRCWGDNLSGQLGNDTRNDSSLPVNVIRTFFQGSPIPLKGMMLVSTGGQHTCALDTNGGVLCWGRNDVDGQVGDGSNIDRLRPVSVPSFTLNIDPVVVLGKKEKVANVKIIATCEEGQRLHGDVDLTQGLATGRGILNGECTGALTSYSVTIRAHGKTDFAEGEAQVKAAAVIRDHGQIVDSQQWTRRVTVGEAP